MSYVIIIIIALENAPYKILDKLKSACSIRKTNSEQVLSQVFPKSLSQDQLTDPLIRAVKNAQNTHPVNRWKFQRLTVGIQTISNFVKLLTCSSVRCWLDYNKKQDCLSRVVIVTDEKPQILNCNILFYFKWIVQTITFETVR